MSSSVLETIFDRGSAPLKDRLGKGSGSFSGVTNSAQPFLLALIARRQDKRRIWIICEDVRSQENFAGELAGWIPGTRIFPDLQVPLEGESLPDPEVAAERLDLLRTFAETENPGPFVLYASQWELEVPGAAALSKAALRLVKGQQLDIGDAAAQLAAAGYERVSQITTRGQFAIRGGILDVYSWQAALPLRVEFFDIEIESLREFDLDSQTSVNVCESAEILVGNLEKRLSPLRTYLKKSDLVIDLSGTDATAKIQLTEGGDDDQLGFYPQPFADFGAGDLVLDTVRRDHFFRQLEKWMQEEWMVVLAANSDGEIERFQELATQYGSHPEALSYLQAPLSRGFVFPAGKLVLLSDAELFGRSSALRASRLTARRERALSSRAALDFTEFQPDDYVVHLEHGIGRFVGLQVPPGTDEGEVLVLEYANEARLFVPLDQAWQVARYVGLGKRNPDLSELGNERWQKAKLKAQQSIFDYTASMLRIQAERDIKPGYTFGPDTHWQQEFEDAFPYQETGDQVRAIAESKTDMESERPMDRLICGDVGFGKTEVAIRAVFKAVMGGKQAAVMAPTTVLAQQHYQTLRERMSDYPVNVELLSRYRTPAEQKKVLSGLIDGSVDVVVGTHRLVSSDVIFKDLGIVVVDEEQRFGVKHKDLLKERFRQIDVLTLSATPIPRTLYMALMGARDMSLIETPPPNRQPVETVVCAYDERVFRDAIQREINRGGQVYFLHNRVRTIEKIAHRIRELCPKARVIIGHGQMSEGELEGVMKSFVDGKADVLVSTTIIESGLDIPNANTIIIDRADLFGLADLYQLRGRVGRSQTKAYAFLMLPRDLMGAARKRVSAIKQYSELGSGFKIAMRDLEIRGAGNLLGTAQSGHIITVGFDLYCKMLKLAVDTMKGQRKGRALPAGLRVDFLVTDETRMKLAPPGQAGAFLPISYISDAPTRISCYRHLAEAVDAEAVDTLALAWRDRFGPPPEPVELALVCAKIRLEAARRRINMVEVKDKKLRLTRRKELVQQEGRFPRLTASDPPSNLREVLQYLESIPCS